MKPESSSPISVLKDLLDQFSSLFDISCTLSWDQQTILSAGGSLQGFEELERLPDERRLSGIAFYSGVSADAQAVKLVRTGALAENSYTLTLIDLNTGYSSRMIDIAYTLSISIDAVLTDHQMRRIASEELDDKKRALLELQLLLRLWKAGRWSYDIKEQVNEVDENWKEIFGVQGKAFEKDYHCYFEEHIHPEDSKRLYRIMDDYLSGKEEVYHSTFRFFHPDGTLHWIEGIGVISEYDSEGDPLQVIGLNRDITEEQESRERLMRTNSLLTSVLEHMPSGVFWKDLDSVYLGANSVFAHDAGAESSEDVVGKTDLDLPFVSADYEYFRKQDLQVLERREPVLHQEYSLRLKDGSPGWSYTSKVPLLSEDGEPFGLLGVYTDITDLKRTEIELKEKQQTLKAITDASVDIIFIFSDTLEVSFVSPAVTRILGYGPDHLQGRSLEHLMGESAYRRFSSAASKLLLKEGPEQVLWDDLSSVSHLSLSLFTLEGRSLVFDIVLSPLVDQKRGKGLLGVFRDMTEQFRLQEQLRHSQKVEAVGRLAAGIAHDFNNLLQVMLGYTELMGDSIDPKGPAQPMLSSILDAGHRARALVEQLLQFSQSSESQKRPLLLSELLGTMKEELSLIMGPDILLDLRMDSHLPSIEADASQIQQLCYTLCMNAKEASAGHGHIEIEVTSRSFCEPHQVYGKQMPSGQYVSIMIEDTGRGMDSEQLAILFDPFYTTKPLGNGAGLSLALVYTIVEEHQGFIEVSSRIGEGTRFTIYFPSILSKGPSVSAP